MTVGVDTYVTAAGADAYIAARYPAANGQRAAWEALADADKEACLAAACAELECLPYRGVKFAAGQALAFPRYLGERCAMLNGTLYAPEADRYPVLREVPQAVKDAQVEEALELACPTEATHDRAARGGAVQSYSIGRLSETFALAAGGSSAAVLASARARQLIAPYTGGAYDVR